MDIDPIELEGQAEEAASSKSRLNAAVAVTIAIIATFMGICKVKDDNIVQAMQQAQAKSVDSWSYYQARNTQAKDASIAADQMKLAGYSTQGQAKIFAIDRAIHYSQEAARLTEEKEKIKKDAEGYDKSYDDYNFKDDQFDLSDAMLAVAISMLAVTSLTQKKFLYWIALVPTFFGLIMGVAGLLGLQIHPDFIIKLLS